MLANKSCGQPEVQEETFQFNLLGTGYVTASFLAEHDELLDTMVGYVKVLSQPQMGRRSSQLRAVEVLPTDDIARHFQVRLQHVCCFIFQKGKEYMLTLTLSPLPSLL